MWIRKHERDRRKGVDSPIPPALGIPENLSEWIPATELVDLVSFTARRLYAGGAEPEEFVILEAPRFQRALAATLVFCYATGVYATADVECARSGTNPCNA